MNSEPICFVAASTREVVAQIRSSLGPEAVVLNVRPLRPSGLARFWQKPMVEVLACRPQPPASQPAPVSDDMAELRHRLARLERQFQGAASTIDGEPAASPSHAPRSFADSDAGAADDEETGGHLPSQPHQWRVGPILQRTGLLPIHAERIVEQLRVQYGEKPPISMAEEIGLARALMTQTWRPVAASADHSLHVLIGAPGSGKTASLCKWLSQVALVEGRLARVWRVDGATANLAQNLSVYCEVLGVAVDRFWDGSGRQSDRPVPAIAEDVGFIDLPGVDWRDAGALEQLTQQIKGYGPCQLHLVVNAAYETPVLLSQIRAFAALPITDLIVTHLDEEPRWGKIWNLILGTNYTVRYLSTGQNVPGDFQAADAEAVLTNQFAGNEGFGHAANRRT